MRFGVAARVVHLCSHVDLLPGDALLANGCPRMAWIPAVASVPMQVTELVRQSAAAAEAGVQAGRMYHVSVVFCYHCCFVSAKVHGVFAGSACVFTCAMNGHPCVFCLAALAAANCPAGWDARMRACWPFIPAAASLHWCSFHSTADRCACPAPVVQNVASSSSS